MLLHHFMAQLEPEPNSGCWLWVGGYSDEYGITRFRGEPPIRAHRAAYRLLVGPICDGLYVCHRCDTPACVNPDHLFLGTAKDNAQDMLRKGRQHDQRRSHCLRGHPLTPDNVYEYADTRRQLTRRACRTCMRDTQRRWSVANKQAA